MDLIEHLGGAGELFARLGAATLVGCIIGLNRDLRGKPAGVRTHSIVSLGSALLTVTSLQLGWLDTGAPGALDHGAVSRVMQGIITGIGFIGAGVILRDDQGKSVHGLTTAASIWLVACFGMTCGLGLWITALLALGLTLAILLLGGPLERAVHRRFRSEEPAGKEPE
jgi:putative Mg2+ transporter-C (MgtC) family protein